MRYRLTSFCVPLLLCPMACAQLISPKGFNLIEGNDDVFSSHFLYMPSSRFQFTDGSQRGTAFPGINQFSIRRRASEWTDVYPARTATLTVVMAHCDVALLTTTFATNYKGSPTTVLSATPVSFPDWSTGPIAPPAPWVPTPFTTPFSYNGTDDLLLECQTTGVTPATQWYPIDCVFAGGDPNGVRYYNGLEPCTVGTNTFDIYFNNTPPLVSGGTVTLNFYAQNGPKSSSGVLVLGLSSLFTTFGGQLCAHLHPYPDVQVPVTSNAVGDIASSATPLQLAFPYPGTSFIVWGQFVVLDPSQAPKIPVALSDDVKHKVAPYPPYPVSRLSSTTSSTVATGTRSQLYIPIIRYN